MSEDFGTNIVSVLDDEGNEHQFELLDAIEPVGIKQKQKIFNEINQENQQ